jgi:phosphatidylglycerol:prolipoprotein diacylglycerol transferase
VKPIPVSFHIGPLEVHTYGIGLALTFWFAYRYFERRLRANGYATEWFTGVFLWIVAASIIGARLLHVLANLSTYTANPGEILQVWHGGLSSFGGLLFGIPTGLILARRHCPELTAMRALDIVSPVLMAAWGVGRLLGPQLMVAGGGHPTREWFGMYYAGQVGKRLPVPILQAIDSFIIFGILLLIERYYRDRPVGFILAATMALWGLARFFEERLWLGEIGHLGSVLVQGAGLALFVAGLAVMAVLHRRHRRHAMGPGPEDSAPRDEVVTTAGVSEPAAPSA